jgi:hypothetical protein
MSHIIQTPQRLLAFEFLFYRLKATFIKQAYNHEYF